MTNSREAAHPNQDIVPSAVSSQYHQNPPKDLFAFLKPEHPSPKSPSYFSKDGLSQDIINITYADPDICLEVFYALHNTLLHQIDNPNGVSLKDAWTLMLGTTTSKGMLCPPERLLDEIRVADLKKALSNKNGETQVFHTLDKVVEVVSHFQQKLRNSPLELSQKEEMVMSLTLVQEFYQGFKNKVIKLVHEIIEKNLPESYDALETLIEPKAIMMSEVFNHHWAYRVPRSQARKLLSLNASGAPIPKDATPDQSNHRVFALPEKGEPLVYFKANGQPSIEPHKEFMLFSLYRHLQIPVPETSLVILTNVFEENPDFFYAVQASEAVSGESTLKAYRDPEIVFKNEAYVRQVIGAFLTNPSDGTFQNFKYSPKYETLISIDNDYVFGPELRGKDGKTVSIRSALYLLCHMENKPIPESVQTYFTTLDPYLTILAWIKDLSSKNEEYMLLFSRFRFQHTRCAYQNLHRHCTAPSLEKLMEVQVKVDGDDSFFPNIVLSKDLIESITSKFQKIEQAFRKNRSASPQIIFGEVCPILAKYYEKLRAKFKDDPETAMNVFGREKRDCIDYSCLDSLLDNEEMSGFRKDESRSNKDIPPEEALEEVKRRLASGPAPLDNFIARHRERRFKDSLDLQEALKELRILRQEELINSKSIRDIADFLYDLSKISQNSQFAKEIQMLLWNLPHAELKWLLTLDQYFMRAESPVQEGSIAVAGAFMRRRRFNLTKSENSYVFDQKGEIRKHASLTGRSKVTFFPEKKPQFYLKQHPEFPGYEYASTLLMRLLGIKNLPYQDLIVFNSESKGNAYPVLLTQKVDGNLVLRVWKDPKAFCNLDPFHTGLIIIAAMLINPEDGKEDNYIISKDGKFLTPIDSDHSFLPSTLRKEGNFWNAWTVNTALQTKTVLFCLDEMNKPIPLDVKQHLLSINLDELLIKWIEELNQVEDNYSNLIDDQQRDRFLENGTVLRIPFYEQFLDNIHWKAHKIEDLLKASSDVTPFDLLKAVEPFAAKCYQDSFTQGTSLETRFKAATDKLYTKTIADGSRMSILNTRTMMEVINVSKRVILSGPMAFKQMRPIDALPLLKKLINERQQMVTAEKELLFELDDNIVESKWTVFFENSVVEATLKEFFTDPKKGLTLKGSKLITSSTLVEFLQQSSKKGANIRFLSLPQSPLLSSETIKVLAEGCPNIEYLDISHCVKLKEIRTERGEWPLLTRLEAKGCLFLRRIVCFSPVKILRIGTSRNIEILLEQSIPDVLIVNMNLEKIKFEFFLKRVHNFEIKSQDQVFSKEDLVPDGPDRFEKYFQDLKIKMKKHYIFSAKGLGIFIDSIDRSNQLIGFEGIKRITELNLMNLRKLDLSNCSLEKMSLECLVKADLNNLSYLNLSGNQKLSQDILILRRRKWPLLETIDLQNIEITNIEGLRLLHSGRKWPNLKEIILMQWGNTKRDMTNPLEPKYCSSIENLNLHHAGIEQTEIEFIVNELNIPQLKHFDLSDNNISDEGFSVLAQGEWPLLETLDLVNIEITWLRVFSFLEMAKWPNLKEIILSELGTIKRDESKYCCSIEKLNLHRSGMKQSEVEILVNKMKLTQLKHLDISENEIFDEGLSVLALGDWPLLESLSIKDTKITQKGIEKMINQSQWPHLKCLEISDNEIEDEGLSLLTRGKWSFFEKLDFQSIKMTSKGIEKFINQFEWSHLKCLKISDNEIKDEGFSVFAHGQWPLLEELRLRNTKISSKAIDILVNKMNLFKLKILDVSENAICDEGLSILGQGKWDQLEHIIYYDIGSTLEGNIAFLANHKWKNELTFEFSFMELFGDQDERELIYTTIPLSRKEKTIVLNSPHFDSRERNFSIVDSGVRQKVNFISRNQWDEIEEISLSREISPSDIQFGKLPSNMKKFSVSSSQIEHKEFEALSSQKRPLLENLNLSSTGITAERIQLIVDKSNWPNLKRLNVSWNKIGDEGLEILASEKWPLLEDLNLYSTKVTAKGIKLMVDKSNWPNLKKLNIGWNDMGDKGLEILASAKWHLLEDLNLYWTKVTAKGIKLMINKSNWPNLKILNIAGNEIGDEGFEVLTSGIWPLLEDFNLNRTKVTAKGIKLMILKSNWPNLKRLDLSKNKVKDEGLEVLAFEKWSLLEDLSLSETDITAQGIKLMIDKSNWPNLKTLNLSYNKFRDEGLEILASGKWPLLEDLNLSYTDITSQGIQLMVDKSNWPNLKILDLSNNEIDDEGLEILASENGLFSNISIYSI